MGAMGLDRCAKYSTLNKITHVNCAKTGDMEIAHINVLEIAHRKNGVLFLTCFCVLLLILHI